MTPPFEGYNQGLKLPGSLGKLPFPHFSVTHFWLSHVPHDLLIKYLQSCQVFCVHACVLEWESKWGQSTRLGYAAEVGSVALGGSEDRGIVNMMQLIIFLHVELRCG